MCTLLIGAAVLLKGLLSASSRKKTTYRSAALAALQQLLDALGGASGSSSPLSTVDGKEVWGTVSPALIEALQQQLAAVTKQPQQAPSQDKRSAGSTAAAGGALEQQPGDEVKPLPLIETCRYCDDVRMFRYMPDIRLVLSLDNPLHKVHVALFVWMCWRVLRPACCCVCLQLSLLSLQVAACNRSIRSPVSFCTPHHWPDVSTWHVLDQLVGSGGSGSCSAGGGGEESQ